MAASMFRFGSRQIYTNCAKNVPLKGQKIVTWHARHLQRTVPALGVEGMKINMPSLSPTMTEGKIVKWYKQEGDKVTPGDVLCEIQTDKAVMAFETEEEGTMAKILVGEDSDVEVGRLIALMVEDGEDWKDVDIPPDSAAPSGGGAPSTAEAAVSQQAPPVDRTVSHFPTGKPFGPAVKSLLEIYAVSSTAVQPTGPHGRIIKGDVLRYIKENNLVPAPAKPSVPPPAVPEASPAVAAPVTRDVPPPAPVMPRTGDAYLDIPHTNMRKTIAKRLTESKISIPHAYSSIDCFTSNLTKLRKEIVAGGNKVTVNDLIIKAAAVALQRVPEVNSYWDGERIVRVPNIDISVAVATENGLITPIVKDAISLEIPQITATVRELAGKAREGKLQLNEFQGGSFTISNLGMFGITEFTAIINPPQACIMAVGTSRLVLDMENKPCTVMTVTLSCDSRVVDEALASKYLEAFKDTIENPTLLTSGEGSYSEEREAFAF